MTNPQDFSAARFREPDPVPERVECSCERRVSVDDVVAIAQEQHRRSVAEYTAAAKTAAKTIQETL